VGASRRRGITRKEVVIVPPEMADAAVIPMACARRIGRGDSDILDEAGRA